MNLSEWPDVAKGALAALLLIVVIVGFCDATYRAFDFVVDIAATKRCGR